MIKKYFVLSIKYQAKVLAGALGVFIVSFLLIYPALAFEVNANQIFLNDPGFTTNAVDIDKQWGLQKAGFIEAWEKTTGSESVVVAVIDTGVDSSHEDLRSINFVKGYDLISRRVIEPGANSDDNGHGTLIAGVLGAAVNNQAGIAGSNWRISIMPLKVLDQNGKGDTSLVAEGIIWAIDNGAQIINLSLGGIAFERDRILSEAIAYAFKKNAVIVAAAGNDSAEESVNLDQKPVFPVCEDNGQNMIIGVGALDQNDLKTVFSNFGRNCIDVMAPGKRILSTINHDPITKIASPNAYAYASGTSLATPFVSGQAALIKSLYPFASNIQIRDRILSTADQIDFLNLSQCNNQACKGLLGAGRINVKRSLETGIFDQSFFDGDVVRAQENGSVFLISGGKKQLVSSFVYNQRFLSSVVRTVPLKQIQGITEGSFALPLDGTLIKVEKDPTVYMVKNGMKWPILASVFRQRGFKYSNINTVGYSEFESWVTGSFLEPKEGTIVKSPSGKLMFWVIGETLRPINRQFIIDKGIGKFPQLILSDKDIPGFAKGESLAR